MSILNKAESQIYEKVIGAVQTLNPGGFCLDKSFYDKFGITATTNEKQRIGKYFKEQVENGKIVFITFDKKYFGCNKCGYKDASNKIHYQKL